VLQEMRQIALDYLYQELDNKKPVPIDLNQWYEDYSKNNPWGNNLIFDRSGRRRKTSNIICA